MTMRVSCFAASAAMVDGAQQLAATLESAAYVSSRRVFILGALDAAHLPKIAETIHTAEANGDVAVVVAPLDNQMPFADALLQRAKEKLQRDVVAVPLLQQESDFITAANLVCAFLQQQDTQQSTSDFKSPENSNSKTLLSSDNDTLHHAAAALKQNDLIKARAMLSPYLQNNNRVLLAEALVRRLAVQEALARNNDVGDAVMGLQKISQQLAAADEAVAGVGAFLLAYQARQSLRDVL